MKNIKSLGQHWLNNRAVLDEIAELAKTPDDVALVVEIGPGLGTLTSSLLRNFQRVVAVEYDSHLATNLPKSFPGKNLEVINKDILKFDFDEISERYAVAGNIPYYITSPIIEKLLITKNVPAKIVLLVQKEVAERIADEKESMLSLFVKNRASVALGPVVKKAEFTPPPKVDSRVIVLAPHSSGPIFPDEIFRVIAQAFSAPRKKLIHNLAPFANKEKLTDIFNELQLSLDARPADLHLGDYFNLWRKLN